MKLSEILDDPDLRARLCAEGAELVESEVSGKRGLAGIAIKTGFNAMRAVKPGIVQGALDRLLPAFAPAIEPHLAEARRSGDVAAHFGVHADEIAEALLQVTDAKARGAKNKVLKRTYAGLRGQARQHTSAAMPAVGRLLATYTRN